MTISKKKIGIIGGLSHKWVSVERTRKFYLGALENEFDFVFIEKEEDEKEEIDLLINFYGIEGWTNTNFKCPKLFCIHGGAILNESFLNENLQNISNQDGIVVTCNSDIEIIKSLCSDLFPKIHLLPLPVNRNAFFSVQTSSAKELLELDKNAIYIGLVCRLLPQKNPHVFIHMLNMIKKETNKTIKAFMIGDYWLDYPVLDYISEDYPNYMEELITQSGLVEDLIYLPGNLSDPELNCLYNAMDLMIHPTNSLDENFGYVPVEAMACATPVVGALYGGLKDTLIKSVGIGIPTYTTNNGIRMDIKGSLPKILELIENENHDEIRKNCEAHVDELYSYDVLKEKLIHLVNELIDQYNVIDKQKITTRNLIDHNTILDNLPKTTNDINWNYYRRVVEKYVSYDHPIFQSNDYVYLDCNYTIDNNNVKRDDPAWPASYQLSDEELSIFNYCKENSLTFEKCTENKINIKTVQKLIDEGIIVISKNEWR